MRRLVILLALAACSQPDVRDDEPPARATVASRLEQYGAAARARLAGDFARAAVTYPPSRVVFIALKDTAQLEVWADGRYIRTYAIQAASGSAGPKLREGDQQVPEGIYTIDWLNPNSSYHLSLHIDYPNASDRARAAADARTSLGGDIMIHGDAVSIGCLAMGDRAAEDLFVLAADTGVGAAGKVSAILAPTDLRVAPARVPPGAPAWTSELYLELRDAMAAYRR